MEDNELGKLLNETHPILPGQESRAWEALRIRLHSRSSQRSAWSWLVTPSWGLSAALVLGTALFISMGDLIFINSAHMALVSADSQAPGIYATSFYSHAAKAQVVWLDGMEPITGRATYLDPTTSPGAKPPNDPYSL